MHAIIADVTDVALEWAQRNVNNNPHISELIEIRKVGNAEATLSNEYVDDQLVSDETKPSPEEIIEEVTESVPPELEDMGLKLERDQCRPLVLVGVVNNDEHFDFCMCNPPFFESMEEAGQNPKTACGGTPEEMVCPGGERAFIMRIIEDSVVLKHSFR